MSIVSRSVGVAQASVVIQAVIGFGLLAQGERAPDSLHAVYGFAPLAITLFSEGMRVGVAQRELEDVDIDGIDRAEQIAIRHLDRRHGRIRPADDPDAGFARIPDRFLSNPEYSVTPSPMVR